MASEHDILPQLPEAPPSSPQVRHAAISSALARFDKIKRPRRQAPSHTARLTQRTARSTSPSRGRTFMRARYLVAACLALMVVGSAVSLYVIDEASPPFATPPLAARKSDRYDIV